MILSHGLGVSSLIFSIDTIETNLLEHLWSHGYDVWLLDHRASIALDTVTAPSDADVVAREDYPAAVGFVRQTTGAETVQMVAHCYGATTFLMAMLAGLEGVRGAVCSQASTRIVAPLLTRLKSWLYVPVLLEAVGFRSLTARTRRGPGLIERLWDALLELQPVGKGEGCDSKDCHRVTFLYSRLYEHAQLTPQTHAAIPELFGAANLQALRHLALLVRRGKLVDHVGRDAYMPHLGRLAIPMTHIHGQENACFLPESSAAAFEELERRNGKSLYRRVVFPGYGHIDCIFGKDAARDIYPTILEGLEQGN